MEIIDVLRLVADRRELEPEDPQFQRYVKLLISAHRQGLVENVLPMKSMESAEDIYTNVFVSGGLTAEGEDQLAASEANMEKSPSNPVPDARRVMLVHGRDAHVTNAMLQLLRAFGLHPLEFGQLLTETRSATPYVGDAVRAGFRVSQAAIVAFTPDDIVRLRPELADSQNDDECREQFQPRPNVLLEAGMALALFEERTIIVEIGKVKRPRI